MLARYRALSIELPLGEFLWHVVDDRAVMALTSAMPDGELRRRNVLLLLDLAQQFERTGARGLHRFLLWMQRQAAEGEEPPVPGSESRSVRILSIHKSKGLEFPFVFLCDTARLFNKSDTRASVLVHPALGLGPKCTDLEHGVEYPTIARQVDCLRVRVAERERALELCQQGGVGLRQRGSGLRLRALCRGVWLQIDVVPAQEALVPVEQRALQQPEQGAGHAAQQPVSYTHLRAHET